MTDGPAHIVPMPPSPETRRRFWTMECHVCGIEEGMTTTPGGDQALRERTARHNADHADPLAAAEREYAAAAADAKTADARRIDAINTLIRLRHERASA